MEIEVTRRTKQAPYLNLSTPNGAEYVETAWVKITQGGTNIEAGFSRYSTEKDWYLDTQFCNKLPVFNHGEGSRCCTKKIAQSPIVEAIEKAPIEVLGDLS
jgi:hypothetical protein